ncbi:hypothetical protein [Amycolatopsis sp. cmx-4-54]|uniref:hypothetical protein n=1 Tax=Amycolatopsis sp. cmx-4-54 TaxID=2790936 RepID=UPI00397979C4
MGVTAVAIFTDSGPRRDTTHPRVRKPVATAAATESLDMRSLATTPVAVPPIRIVAQPQETALETWLVQAQPKADLLKHQAVDAHLHAQLFKFKHGKLLIRPRQVPNKPPPTFKPKPIHHHNGKVSVSLDFSQVKPGQSRTITRTSPDRSVLSSVTESKAHR